MKSVHILQSCTIATVTMSLLLACNARNAHAHDISPLDDQLAGEAIYRAMALNRVIPDCAALFRLSDKRKGKCEKAKTEYREGFRVRVEECSEGGQIPDMDVVVPTSYTCTVSLKETPDAPVIGRVAILFFAAGQWNALMIGEQIQKLD